MQTVTTGRADLPFLVADAQGEAILAWDEFDLTPGTRTARGSSRRRRPRARDVRRAARDVAGRPARRRPALAVDAAGTTFLAYGSTPSSSSAPAEPSALSHVRPAGGVFGPAIALPASFGGVSLVAAGAQVTALSGAIEGRTLLSDWTP